MMESTTSAEPESVPLSVPIRFLLYGTQGICDEIIFTLLLSNFILGHAWTQVGVSSVSSLFVFGLCSLLIEQIYRTLYHQFHWSLYVRMSVYLLWIYMWEYSLGFILRLFEACPWDYSHYTYNLHGLITLEYAPGWLLLAFLHEIGSEYVFHLRVVSSELVDTVSMTTSRSLPLWLRFYVYGIQGFCHEIIFTALYDFVVTGNWQLKGQSALSSFLIYGTGGLMVEVLYISLYVRRKIGRIYRLPLYLLIAFIWEYMWGLLLRQFNACPWDYSQYTYNIQGLITLEYAPGWLLLSFITDLVAEFLLKVRIGDDVIPNDKKVK